MLSKWSVIHQTLSAHKKNEYEIELENCQKSLTLKDFEEIESKLGYALPERLKEFYLQYNGGSTKQTASINKYQEVEIEDFFPFKYNKDFKNDPRYTAEGETLELRKAGAISDSILIFAMDLPMKVGLP